MPQFVKVQVELNYETVAPGDKSVNTFYFNVLGPGTETQELDDIENAILGFYTAIDEYLSSEVVSPGRIKMYDHLSAPPRVPLRDDTFNVQPGAGPGLPNELAMCVSYRGALESGVNRRRNRGRIYLGPLDGDVANANHVGDVRINSTAYTNVAAAVNNWFLPVAAPISGSTILWSVFSRSNALGLAVGAAGPAEEPDYDQGQLVAGYREIDEAYVDNAFDIQRRRGLPATARATVT